MICLSSPASSHMEPDGEGESKADDSAWRQGDRSPKGGRRILLAPRELLGSQDSDEKLVVHPLGHVAGKGGGMACKEQ